MYVCMDVCMYVIFCAMCDGLAITCCIGCCGAILRVVPHVAWDAVSAAQGITSSWHCSCSVFVTLAVGFYGGLLLVVFGPVPVSLGFAQNRGLGLVPGFFVPPPLASILLH